MTTVRVTATGSAPIMGPRHMAGSPSVTRDRRRSWASVSNRAHRHHEWRPGSQRPCPRCSTVDGHRVAVRNRTGIGTRFAGGPLHQERHGDTRTPGQSRTGHLPLRRRTRYPLRHGGLVGAEGLEPPWRLSSRRLYKPLGQPTAQHTLGVTEGTRTPLSPEPQSGVYNLYTTTTVPAEGVEPPTCCL
jgi:hypothetical protein